MTCQKLPLEFAVFIRLTGPLLKEWDFYHGSALGFDIPPNTRPEEPIPPVVTILRSSGRAGVLLKGEIEEKFTEHFARQKRLHPRRAAIRLLAKLQRLVQDSDYQSELRTLAAEQGFSPIWVQCRDDGQLSFSPIPS